MSDDDNAADEAGQPAGRFRRRWWPASAVGIVLIAITVGVLALHSTGKVRTSRPVPVDAAGCPLAYPHAKGVRPWVPATPAGVDGTSRLVPDETPTAVLLCKYVGKRVELSQAGPPSRLVGHRALRRTRMR